MDTHRLGRSDLTVPPLCFGCNVFGWTADEATSFRLLDALLEAGLNFLDTADVYSRWVEGHTGGESESIIGRWMAARGNRTRVIVATKVGMDMGEGRVGLEPGYIAQAVEASLKRLGTDYIDLYQAHRDDEATPQDETLGAFARLIEAGKVRAIGASNFAPDRFRKALDLSAAHGLPRYETMQPEYNLYSRETYEGSLQQVCVDSGVSVIPFFSLASGFLTGKYRSADDRAGRARGSRVEKYMNAKGDRILAALDAVSAETGAAPASVALAWLVRKPGIAAPIASATSVEQLGALVAAARLSLSGDQMKRLDAAGA